MKVLILAGGKGTRFMEESKRIPKPMIRILDKPMIFYIIEHYFRYGYDDFVILGGEKIEYIVNYFDKNFQIVDKAINKYKINDTFTVQILDTERESMTGGRIKIAVEKLKLKEFMVTYGDGICDVNIQKLEDFFRSKDKIATVTGVKPPARFGNLSIKGDYVTSFNEKIVDDEEYINGGYFVMKSGVIDYIDNNLISLENEPMNELSKKGELTIFRHNGYFQPVDTIREKEVLEKYLLENINDQ
jgi:glucose-1-phosphate cytidylyltransferase|tara:strand:+ start:135 stop:866 length:732 start_codon:yes stop_codon:yes gene_type:complete